MAIYRKSAIVPITAADTTVLDAESAEEIVITSLIFGNVDGSNNATVDIKLHKSGDSAVTLVTNFAVDVGECTEFLIGGKSSIFLESGDVLKVVASASSDVVAMVNYLLVT